MKKTIRLSERNFDNFFNSNYTDLCRYCLRYVRDSYVAEEIVQELFIHLWNKRKEIELNKSYKSYLRVAVRNRSLNYLKSKFANTHFDDNFDAIDHSLVHTPLQVTEGNELNEVLKKGFQSLPEKCYTVFALKKFARLTHKEIAGQLNISEKTVENHITVAIKKLKAYIHQHYDQFLTFCFISLEFFSSVY